MTETHPIGFEQDILDQPAALEHFASFALPEGIKRLDWRGYDRIILTGMGSSDYASIPLELFLARRGLPVWRLPAGRLLETPELVTQGALLLATSQSGRSGEVVALMDLLRRGRKPTVIGITNDLGSPLAGASDVVVPLRCGEEATVSSKSYLNTLAAFYRIGAAVGEGSDAEFLDAIPAIAIRLRAALEAPRPDVVRAAEYVHASGRPRLALIATGPDVVTAMTGALILKEASKLSAEGYAGGAFRHGPLELAGPGLLALLIGESVSGDQTLARLAMDLAATNSLVATVSSDSSGDTRFLDATGSSEFERLALSMVALQHLSIAVSRMAGLVPGEFRFGQKITATL
jgi:glutamine---fructose-6-phosphate transaminase (isomerizing)